MSRPETGSGETDWLGYHTRGANQMSSMAREAYAKGWEDACSLAIARFSALTECAFLATDAIEELHRMFETGAHHPSNRADVERII